MRREASRRTMDARGDSYIRQQSRGWHYSRKRRTHLPVYTQQPRAPVERTPSRRAGCIPTKAGRNIQVNCGSRKGPRRMGGCRFFLTSSVVSAYTIKSVLPCRWLHTILDDRCTNSGCGVAHGFWMGGDELSAPLSHCWVARYSVPVAGSSLAGALSLVVQRG